MELKQATNVTYRETGLNEEVLEKLIAFSVQWESENSCWGYRANAREDIEGRRIFLAYQGNQMIGYLFGKTECQPNKQAEIPPETPVFYVEELYIQPDFRSQGIGKGLFQYAEKRLKGEVEYLVLSTATKNWKAILHFYLEEVDMRFWAATLYRRIPADI